MGRSHNAKVMRLVAALSALFAAIAPELVGAKDAPDAEYLSISGPEELSRGTVCKDPHPLAIKSRRWPPRTPYLRDRGGKIGEMPALDGGAGRHQTHQRSYGR
jgi:hypothetical protein